MKKFFLFMILALCIQYVFAGQASWYEQNIWNQPDRTYQWYPDQQKKQLTQPKPTEPVEVTQFKQLQKNLIEAREIAVMNPTTENLKRYIQLQEIVLGQAASFTDQWKRTIWSNPDLDYSLKSRPTNEVAIRAFDQKRSQDAAGAIHALAKDHGVMFIYRSDCPYCHAMAPIIQRFAVQYGIKIMAVSLDGGPMPGFPKAVTDNGIATKLGIAQVPALFVMDTKSNTFKPIGFGVMSATELEERFLTISSAVGSLY